ncbi:NUDIX hydrolase [Tenuibacillus multivorans]|uniref:ADP-ribose pyrophosphatase YjhB, NUDIX family n=1 Tax=Tenuibacillus multivorans TaxID=237069 RepID=A0A1G9WLE3_9BACI|nr:NUDIX hydrolase [Tenuibacillus multivorans]GEL78018.1 ADP-ribose pyrophosphatase [Tenuibacillus multivorans]SDM85320.1 ADP-ribose pyrophosphatase YjhB, NUDIX family [Tenuibacillus multivorans]
MKNKWLEYAKKLQSIAQSGLTYSKDRFDIERFEEIRNISVDILHHYTELEHEKVRDLFANETGYQTPKIDVRGAIFKEGKILLVKEQKDGLWSLPGGWADIDTSLSEAIMKEAKEEAGLEVKPKRVVTIFDYNKHQAKPLPYSVYKIFVECELVSGAFEKNIETVESGFYDFDELPPLSTRRNTKEQIKYCFEASKREIHETIFD